MSAASRRGPAGGQAPAAAGDEPEPLVFEPSKDILALSRKGGLSGLLQTAIATMFTYMIVVLPLAYVLLVVYVRWLRLPLLAYGAFCFLDPAAESGVGRRVQWARRMWPWRYVNAYFPVRLVLEERLDPSRNYVFGVSPHGIMCFSGQVVTGSQQSGLDEALEGLTVHPIILHLALRVPFFHEYALALGALSSSRESIRQCLAHEGGGEIVAVVVGGAKESLYTNRGSRRLVLGQRKGFVREAIMAGAPLVPTFIFGENDLFKQLEHPLLRKAQLWLQSKMMFAVPLFYGRFGLVPNRTPLTTIIGRPIAIEKDPKPSPETISRVHAQYLSELRRLYARFKPIYDPAGDDLVII
ncbi:2-acylglycerol O-acyltransferase 1 [Coemansia biformis]|uniref:Diacylglycerol O-acyltransferase n=1 Tax=Coemansia biformis TaxID=1286918 RepID=A0A9W8CYB8_9FUNG|nr:2-acylglycerol O-acyltransferase 1 [Coemansia biformis]